MIQTATLSPSAPLHPRTASAKMGGKSGDFADSFDMVSDEAKPDSTAAAPEDEPRQDDAATGNGLPLPGIVADPAFVWTPIIATPVPVFPASPAVMGVADATGTPSAIVHRPVFTQMTPHAPTATPTATPAPTPAFTELDAAPPPTLTPPPPPAQAGGTPAMQLAAAIMAAVPPASASAQAVDTPTTAVTATDMVRWTAPATSPVILAAPRPDVQPGIVPAQPGTVAAAAMVFGAAIQAATGKRDEPDIPAAPSDTPLTPVGAAATHEIKVADTQQAPLDMRQERWPHAMIERIEMLRDAADAVDTRIRLVPDALGAIDVSVRKDGDGVRVHFSAEQAATRTLLADAQPRLADLAEARGLKLAQGSLGDADRGAPQQRSPTPPQTSNRLASASTLIANTPDDIRIA